MHSIKIRTTAATLAATFAVGLAGAPIAQQAHAAVNDGRYQQSGEAKRKKICADLEDTYDKAKANRKRALWRGDKKLARQIQQSLDNLQTMGEFYNCDWAA
jgi:hypothetical protein